MSSTSEMIRAVVGAYAQLHPSMYPLMRWRISKANVECIVNAMGHDAVIEHSGRVTMLGIPVDFHESDAIELVMKVR